MRYLDSKHRITQNFTVREFTRSSTADANGIDIRIVEGSPVHRAVTALCECVLQPLRDALGQPVHITSGYRPAHVNALVGGVEGSDHTKGKAADITVSGMTPLELAQQIKRLGLEFDQLIQEFDRWVHVSFSGRRRMETLTAWTHPDGGTRYEPGLHCSADLSQETST